MKRIGKFLFGVLLFVALGYLLVYVTRAQTHFESHTDRRWALVNQAGAIVVIVYADEVTHNEGSGASGFYRGGNLIAWVRDSAALSIKEMVSAQPPQVYGKEDK